MTLQLLAIIAPLIEASLGCLKAFTFFVGPYIFCWGKKETVGSFCVRLSSDNAVPGIQT